MKKTFLVLFCASVLVGCKVALIDPSDMTRIEAQSLARDPGLSRYAYPWMYVGSDVEFDYILFSGVIGDQTLYRIEKNKLNLEKRFERTKDESAWIPINSDGSTRLRKTLPIKNP